MSGRVSKVLEWPMPRTRSVRTIFPPAFFLSRDQGGLTDDQ
jgi:hypothetical protein